MLGLGTWMLTRDTADTVEYALELGYRMIDTAFDYGSQRGVGRALERTSVPRDEVYLVAKVEEDDDAYDATRRYLDEMRQAYADLVVIHRPPPHGAGEALWEGLVRARAEGLARDIGISNYSIDQMERLTAATGETPVVNQIEWSPFGWSREMLGYCRAHDIVIQAYSPLTRGERLDDAELARIAAVYGRTGAQVLIRWAIQKRTPPLPKANRREHLEENLGAMDFEIRDADMDRLDALNEQWSALGASPQYL